MAEILDDSQLEYSPLPEIYSIELTSSCDLQCPMCLRSTNMERHPKILDVTLLQKMSDRGDFDGTTFIELQMAGEPTIHPRLADIIVFLHEIGLMVGLSTHGLNLHKPNVAYAVSLLNTLTISIDSTNPEIYHKMRYPATFDKLLASLDSFFEYLESNLHTGNTPFIEFQLVKTSLVPGSGDIDALKELVDKKSWLLVKRIRTNKDCFSEMQGRMPVGTMPRPGNGQVCQNPFSSVSVNDRGDVVSCCMIFDPNRDSPNWYGNLNESSLTDIWNGERVRRMRLKHRIGAKLANLPGECAKCYAWSPTQIHQNIIRGLIQIK